VVNVIAADRRVMPIEERQDKVGIAVILLGGEKLRDKVIIERQVAVRVVPEVFADLCKREVIASRLRFALSCELW